MSSGSSVPAPESDLAGWNASGRVRWFPWLFVAVLGSALLAAVVLTAVGVFPRPWGGDEWAGYWFVLPIGFLLLWVFVLCVRPWGWRGAWRGTSFGPWSAQEIVRGRYARGEISREQMLDMLRSLEESPGRPLSRP